MIRRTIPLLLCTLCATTAAQGYADEITAGRRLYEASRFDEALTHFARARALGPNDWRGHAWQAFTLIEQARGAKDQVRRLALLKEAEKVTNVLVKNKIVLFQDPLYKFTLGVIYNVTKDEGKALEAFRQAYRAPRHKFTRYAEIELRANVERAFAKVSVHLATRLITRGKFEPADRLLEEATRLLPAGDPDWILLERQYAAVSENLSRHKKAIFHLRRCIEHSKGNPKAVQELTGAIAMIFFNIEEFEEGAKVLATLPPDCTHPAVIDARATAHYKRAMKAPDGEEMHAALQYHRKAIEEFPADDRYRLVVPYVELILEKVGPREAEKERPLLQHAEKLTKIERDRRPECPSTYYCLYRIYRLLGKDQLAIHYQDLHAQKKAEYVDKEHYDDRGRPRCR